MVGEGEGGHRTFLNISAVSLSSGASVAPGHSSPLHPPPETRPPRPHNKQQGANNSPSWQIGWGGLRCSHFWGKCSFAFSCFYFSPAFESASRAWALARPRLWWCNFCIGKELGYSSHYIWPYGYTVWRLFCSGVACCAALQTHTSAAGSLRLTPALLGRIKHMGIWAHAQGHHVLREALGRATPHKPARSVSFANVFW